MVEVKNLYPEAEMDPEKAKRLAEAHEQWFSGIIGPILVSFGMHLYGHGWKDAVEKNQKDSDE